MLDASPNTLDRSGRLMIIALTLVESVLLLLAHDGIEAGWGWFATSLGRTLWYSLGITLPLVGALLLNSARDRYAARVTLACALVLLPLAWHSGNACLLASNAQCAPVFAPYGIALSAALFVLLPYLQAGRQYGLRASYAELFHYAWDNFLTLGAAAVFAGAGWLILLLWAGLFGLIGVDFFGHLFEQRPFIYPVTGLFAGFGLMLARSQQGALRSVLKVCLALGRGLLPLLAILCVVFLLALALVGVQPLWATRYAATLLLALIAFMVVLVNAAFQDGDSPAPARPLRLLVAAALLTLPVYAALALIALQLRTAQYGWTVDRLWATWAAGFALLYAAAYALATWRSPVWLARMASANRAIALLFAVTLLLTQSPLLDFRAISIHSQLARWERGDIKLDALDLTHLRWELGQPGLDALQRLQEDPRVKADAVTRKRIEALLAAQERWSSADTAVLTPETLLVLPRGATVPPELFAALGDRQAFVDTQNCVEQVQSCALIAVDLNGDGRNEWVFVKRRAWGQLAVFSQQDGHWRLAGWLRTTHPAQIVEVMKTLEQQPIAVETPTWKTLRIGTLSFDFQPRD